jgi:hypothetical protein
MQYFKTMIKRIMKQLVPEDAIWGSSVSHYSDTHAAVQTY